MDNLSEKDKKDSEMSFKDLESDSIKETIEEHKEGTVQYKQIAKKYSPSELTDERIKEIVDLMFPLYGRGNKDVSQDDRKKRNKQRNNLKKALEDRAREAPKVEQKIIKEDLGKKERLQEQVHKLNPNVDLEGLEEEELHKIAANEIEIAHEKIMNGSVNFLFRCLKGVAVVAEYQPFTEPFVSFRGVYKDHDDNADEIKEILSEIIMEYPEIMDYTTPINRLGLTLGYIYGEAARRNATKKTSLSGSSTDTLEK